MAHCRGVMCINCRHCDQLVPQVVKKSDCLSLNVTCRGFIQSASNIFLRALLYTQSLWLLFFPDGHVKRILCTCKTIHLAQMCAVIYQYDWGHRGCGSNLNYDIKSEIKTRLNLDPSGNVGEWRDDSWRENREALTLRWEKHTERDRGSTGEIHEEVKERPDESHKW